MPQLPPTRQICSSGDCLASELIARDAGWPVERGLDLIRLGAVYVNRNRLDSDRPLAAGDYLRYHPAPRRFPSVDWAQRLVASTDEYVVVNKPAGIPVHPTCDNATENALAGVSRWLGEPLWIAHRLDMATQGLLLLAKTPGFCRHFGKLLEKRLVHKHYRALVRVPIPVGPLVHYLEPAERGPYRMADEPHPDRKRCELVVEAVAPVASDVLEARVKLVTGRHHQIRAQLAAVGAPIVGDVLYGSDATFRGEVASECIALQACSLEFPTSRAGESASYRLPSPWRAV